MVLKNSRRYKRKRATKKSTETESEADEEIPYCLCCDLFVDLEIAGEEEF